MRSERCFPVTDKTMAAFLIADVHIRSPEIAAWAILGSGGDPAYSSAGRGLWTLLFRTLLQVS